MQQHFYEGVLTACRGHLSKAKVELAEILDVKGARTVENTLVRYNELSRNLDAAGSLAGLMANVHPNDKVRTDAETCEQELSQFATELSLNRKLFEAFSQVDGADLRELEKRFVKKRLLDFKRSGVDRDDKTRERIKKLNEEIVQIGQEFDRNVREDVRFVEFDSVSGLEGLPQDYIDAHKAGSNGKIKITTDYPDSIPYMTYAKSAEGKRRLAFESKNRGYPKNEKILKALLEKRHEMATLLGYKNWAAYVTEDKMIKTDDAVRKFLNDITAMSGGRAKKEVAELLAEKKKDDSAATVVEDYEKGYYEERVKINKYAFDSKSVREYFEFTRVKDGLLKVTGDLFGLHYEKQSAAKVWHDSVDVYAVFDRKTKKNLGTIYLDLHPREGKYKHAAQFTLRSGVDGVQLPEGVLVCNFPDPRKSSGPALMEHSDVVTLFHEFGHLIHHILGGSQKWIYFSGVATEWDFVEAPSQLLEEWAWDEKVLASFAHHYKTGKTIPSELVKKMRDADEFGQGFGVRQQMFYANLSLDYHSADPNTFDMLEKLKELQKKISVFPYQEDTHFHLNFGHLNGYSAMYYTYMWSLVIAKDLFSEFQKNGLMDEKTALKYRHEILERGGTKDAADLAKNFLGREYSFEAFRKWLDRK